MTTDLPFPKGHGLVRVASDLRRHVGPQSWLEPATDYWISSGNADFVTTVAASTGDVSGLDTWGWTTTTLGISNTTTGDFMSSSDDTPAAIVGADASDELLSPFVFGNYSSQLMAGQLMGYMPARLIAEFYAAFTTASANETGTHIGFQRAAGTIVVSVFSDATNFQLRTGASVNEAGAAVDNNYHLWRITLDSITSLAEWHIDGTSQGTVALPTDTFPCGFGLITSTTNRLALSWAHVFYE